MIRSFFRLVLLSFIFALFVGCATVPPVFVYNRSYTDTNYGLTKSRLDESKPKTPFTIGVILKPSKDLIEKNNQRYVYGSFLKRLRRENMNRNSRDDSKKAFDIKVVGEVDKSFKYLAEIKFEDYGRDFVMQNSGVEKSESKIKSLTTDCFYLEVEILNPNDISDRFSFKSNGCPGVSDPRLVASKIFDILFDDLWAVDSTKTYTLMLNGTSSDSWFSALETDSEVDRILGYPIKEVGSKIMNK